MAPLQNRGSIDLQLGFDRTMHLSPQQFLDSPKKSITLMGMSGVGKTTLAHKLPRSHWFHYSGDYRIGSRYLSEPIVDNLKKQAMQVPFLRDLLMNDSIYIGNNISFNNLAILSTFLGKLGNSDLGGLPIDEFKYRQELHKQAEISAMYDISRFIDKASAIYGYPHFINDAGGSVCELNDDSVIEHIAKHTVIFYIEADQSLEETLIERAIANPKPIYYQSEFLDTHLQEFLELNQIESVSQIEPDRFVKWIFPKTIRHRKPLYRQIADKYGYTLSAHAVNEVRNEQEVVQMLADAIKGTQG